MKLPRNVGGEKLISCLSQYGYRVVRQTGSHIRVTSIIMGTEHHLTIPQHTPLKTGTLNRIITDVATYLEIEKSKLIDTLFG